MAAAHRDTPASTSITPTPPHSSHPRRRHTDIHALLYPPPPPFSQIHSFPYWRKRASLLWRLCCELCRGTVKFRHRWTCSWCECGSMCTHFLFSCFPPPPPPPIYLGQHFAGKHSVAMQFTTVFTHQPMWGRLIMDAERASECPRTHDAVFTCALTLGCYTKPRSLFKGISNWLLSPLFCIIWLSLYPSIVLKNLILLTEIHNVTANLFSVMLASSLSQTQYIPEAVTPMGITSSRALSVNGFPWQNKHSYPE